MLQMAGHLRGRVSQEWNLLAVDDLADFENAVKALQERLEPGSRVLVLGRTLGIHYRAKLRKLPIISVGWWERSKWHMGETG